MVAIAVLGIITALAVPQYSGYVRESRRADATISIQNILSQQTLFRANFGGVYTSHVRKLGFAEFNSVTNKTLSDNDHYVLTLTACDATGWSECVNIEAEPQAGEPQAADRCQVFAMNTRGVRRAWDTGKKNDITGECWE